MAQSPPTSSGARPRARVEALAGSGTARAPPNARLISGRTRDRRCQRVAESGALAGTRLVVSMILEGGAPRLGREEVHAEALRGRRPVHPAVREAAGVRSRCPRWCARRSNRPTVRCSRGRRSPRAREVRHPGAPPAPGRRCGRAKSAARRSPESGTRRALTRRHERPGADDVAVGGAVAPRGCGGRRGGGVAEIASAPEEGARRAAAAARRGRRGRRAVGHRRAVSARFSQVSRTARTSRRVGARFGRLAERSRCRAVSGRPTRIAEPRTGAHARSSG